MAGREKTADIAPEKADAERKAKRDAARRQIAAVIDAMADAERTRDAIRRSPEFFLRSNGSPSNKD